MPHAPTTEETSPAICADESHYDAALGVYTLFLTVPRVETVYFRLVVESWEDFAVARTMQRFDPDDPSRSIVVVMAVAGYLAPCVKSLSRLAAEIGGRQVPATDALREALRQDILDAKPELDVADQVAGSCSSAAGAGCPKK